MPDQDHRMKVAFLGPQGTYTHEAVIQQFGKDIEAEPQSTIGSCFEALHNRKVDYAVVPFENSTNGQVVFTYDLLRDWHLPKEDGKQAEFTIIAEQFVAIHHYLLSNASNLADVKVLYSHPQVWGQVSSFLENSELKNAKIQNTNSTAEAAQIVKQDTTNTSACICSKMSAQLNYLPVRQKEIEDFKGNTTRFLVLGFKSSELPTPPSSSPNDSHSITSLMFVLNHNDPGALVSALDSFRHHNINLTSIASRPSGITKWQYVFFVEAEGSASSEALQKSISKLHESCTHVVVLGSFARDSRYWS